jgi:hypothetical protein
MSWKVVKLVGEHQLYKMFFPPNFCKPSCFLPRRTAYADSDTGTRDHEPDEPERALTKTEQEQEARKGERGR